MLTNNWTKIAVALALGIAIGLIYGWVINPVEYTNVTPNLLRLDYRTDYVLMVAEAYQSEQDASLAARRLAMLGSDSPAQIVSTALEYARSQGFSPDDIIILQGLLSSMQIYQPAGEISP